MWTHGTALTSLVPYHCRTAHGLWQGLDALGFDYMLSSATLGLVGATGGYIQGGHHVAGGDVAAAHDHHDGGVTLSVRSRGAWGSTTSFPATSSSLYIAHFWVTDQDGRAVCEYCRAGRPDIQRPVRHLGNGPRCRWVHRRLADHDNIQLRLTRLGDRPGGVRGDVPSAEDRWLASKLRQL